MLPCRRVAFVAPCYAVQVSDTTMLKRVILTGHK